MRHLTPRSRTGTDESSSLLDRLWAAVIEPNSRDTIAGFVALASISLGTRYLADLEAGDLADDWLLPAAVQAEPVLVAVGLAAVLAVHFLGRGSVLLGWGDLERGRALRLFTSVLLVAVTWPGFVPFARAEPFVFGLPFALAWIAGWIAGSVVVLALLDRVEKRHRDARGDV